MKLAKTQLDVSSKPKAEKLSAEQNFVRIAHCIFGMEFIRVECSELS